MKMTIVGCGNMGGAFAECLSQKNQLFLYDRHFDKSKKLEENGFGKASSDIQKAVLNSNIIIIAVKPKDVFEIGQLIGNILNPDQMVISLLAGTPIKLIKELFPCATVVRMMPNLAVKYGKGIIGAVAEEDCSEIRKDHLNAVFSELGTVYWLPEDQINALTSLTGSGPAFFFVMIEAMVDAAVAMGFTAIDARHLVIEMLNGSLDLLEKSSMHPGELKQFIASPKGTTIAGLRKLEQVGLRSAIIECFLAAFDRANELRDQKR